MSFEAENPPASISRRHDLDALRAGAMLLGIGLHACLSYVTFPFWPVYDAAHTHTAFDLFFVTIHGFRMPLFFMVSGFFTAMLWRKRGLSALIRHRAKRIALPLILFTLTIMPLVALAIAYDNRPIAGIKKNAALPGLFQAARSNDVDAFTALLPEIEDLNAGDPEHTLTALHWATLSGSIDITRILLQQGADVNARIPDQSSPLIHAAFTARPEIAALLLAHGAEPNVVNVYGQTALDASHLDWDTVAWAAAYLSLELDQEAWEGRREATRKLLVKSGCERKSEQKPDKARSGLTGSYLNITDFWAFHAGDILGHLWFLWFLCLLLIPFAIFATIADSANWRGPPPWLFLSPALLLWLVPLTMIPQWFNGLRAPGFGPDTSSTLLPFPHLLLLYGVFFFAGALYFDCDDPEGKLGRRWWLTLPLALFVVLPVGLFATFEPGAGVPRVLPVFLQALYPWLMTLGLIGLGRNLCCRESRILRYVSDSSYWLYVAHLPLILLAQSIARPWDVPAFAKFAFVCLSVTTFLLITYQLLVRYSWLGTLLNGKRQASGRPVA
jgi:peptidoglycan/LPS O-acetylase OafA/YrhL